MPGVMLDDVRIDLGFSFHFASPGMRLETMWSPYVRRSSARRYAPSFGQDHYCFVRLSGPVFVTVPNNPLEVMSAVPVSEVPLTIPLNVSCIDPPIGNWFCRSCRRMLLR